MIFHVLSVFPELVQSVFDYGVLRRAVAARLISHNIRDLRDFTNDPHRSTDDQPYGGGPGMVMLCEPIFKAVESLRQEYGPLPLVCLTPAGKPFSHEVACQLARSGDFIQLCGRYEGIDQRVLDHLADFELSIGDYVLSGGELAAMVVIDAVARQLPGVVGNEESLPAESFATASLDYPHYTRPEAFRGLQVPEVLLSGHHARIAEWRLQRALVLTYQRRPDLLTAEQIAAARAILDDTT